MNKEKNEKKPKILIICDFFLPGYKSGGLRTLANTVERFKNRFDFWVITRDHDSDRIQFDSVKVDEWNKIADVQVFYLSRKSVNISKLRELIQKVRPDSIYINSIFSTLSNLVLVLHRLALIPSLNIVIAPEGELSEGALKLKPKKKRFYLKLAKVAGLHKNLIWKTTSEFEKIEAEAIKGKGGKVFIAPNLPARTLADSYRQALKPEKKAGEVKMVFLSRFMRKKNFNWLFQAFDKVTGNLFIDIYGPLEDEDYWEETRQFIKKMSKNITIDYKGSIPYEKVVETIFDYHFFILPTLGENFGHVFVEALAAGCPLIISNRTPWVNLEQEQIGWDLPLEKPEIWKDIINYCLDLNNETYSELSRNARSFAVEWLSDPKVEESTLIVLENSLKTL